MISIIIPTYNRESLICRALDSVLKQTYVDWECIVVDDGSSDNTVSVVKKYTELDSRFEYLTNSRSKGAQGARNTGIIAARGEWIVLFDSDNRMHPSFLNAMVEEQKKQNINVCSSWSNIINEESDEIIGSFSWSGYGNVHAKLMTGKSYFDNSSTMIKRQLLFDIGLLDEFCPAFQEWDTHIRLSRTGTYSTIQKCLIDYYTGLSDSISANKSKDVKGYLYVLTKHKEEWKRDYYVSFLKYGAILKSKMDINKVDEFIVNNYNSLFNKCERSCIIIFEKLYKLKKLIRGNYK